LHHGTLNALLLPPVLRFNAPAITAKARTLNDALGIAADADPATFIEGLNQRLGLPANLRAMGLERSVFGGIADAALLDHCHTTNPRAATRDDYLRMLESVY
ncbi:MAG: iron-containing alcohol dehydrogenase, partial [Burkholderiaceae bacterium]|nr:iron-containing alcohol dehydrogenase [Burkholderiaceae bacterium]